MVSVYFGYDNNAVLNVDAYFDHAFKNEWLRDKVVQKMIKDIDNSDVLSEYCIQSPVLGQIPPEKLSGGVKACILLWLLDDIVVDLTACGENCEDWLVYIFNNKDKVRVSMSGYDLTFKNKSIYGVCENDNSSIRDYNDWIIKMCEMAGESENER